MSVDKLLRIVLFVVLAIFAVWCCFQWQGYVVPSHDLEAWVRGHPGRSAIVTFTKNGTRVDIGVTDSRGRRWNAYAETYYFHDTVRSALFHAKYLETTFEDKDIGR